MEDRIDAREESFILRFNGCLAAIDSLSAVCSSIMSATLSEEHERELRKIFDDYDQNGSGDIDIDELRDIAEDLGEPLSEIELEYLAKEFDTDENGTISWTEFITWWKLPF